LLFSRSKACRVNYRQTERHFNGVKIMHILGLSAAILFPVALIGVSQQGHAASATDIGSPVASVTPMAAQAAATAATARGGDQRGSVESDIGRPVRTDEIEERADTSFSAYPLGEETLSLNSQGFKLLDDECTKSDDVCVWRDPNGVLHYLNEDNTLTSKAVVAKDFADRSIAALGIGTARNRPAVLANASRYLLGAKAECLEPGEAGEGDGIASCTYEFSKIRIKLLFDGGNQLIRADLYQVGGI